MHMQGEPRSMQSAPGYVDVVQDVSTFLSERMSRAIAAGIDSDRIVLDPGIGFGKLAPHNLELLARQGELLALGRPLLGVVAQVHPRYGDGARLLASDWPPALPQQCLRPSEAHGYCACTTWPPRWTHWAIMEAATDRHQVRTT
jgi:hypothetical protein